MSKADELLAAASKSSLGTKKESKKTRKSDRVGLYGVTEEMRNFIEDELGDKTSSYIMRALRKQLKADGYTN